MYLMVPRTRNSLDWQSIAEAGDVPVLLIRHGQTIWNKERRFLGCSDVELDETGRTQAALAASALADLTFQSIHSSPLSRARVTAETVGAGRGLAIQLVNGLQELNQGELEGRFGADVVAQYPEFIQAWATDPRDVRCPGGETMQECADRSVAALGAILKKAKPGPPVAIFTHRMVLSCLICHALDLPLRMWQKIGQKNTAINLLSWRDGKLTVHRLNDVAHLNSSI